MKTIAKKLTVLFMLAALQCGLGATISEAAARHNDSSQPQQRYEDSWQQPGNDHNYRQQDQQRMENARHEQENQRRDHESYQDWQQRIRIENQRHDDAVTTIAAGAILYMVLNNN